MIAISIGNGSGDAQGSQRGLEYDTMSGKYAEFVEKEVLPLVEKTANVKLTKDPEGRATMGGSSGGSCALIMAWYHPELYHRVLTYSGTYVNQQWPANSETPHGAWEFHEHLIPTLARPSRCASGWKSATGTISTRASCATISRLGAGQREHGQGAGREGLSLSVCVRAQCGAYRSRGEAADSARGVGIRVAGVPDRGERRMKVRST